MSILPIYMNQPFPRYLASLLIMFVGLLLAAHHYPGGFDWPYTVASALMSQKHNPTGSFWFSASLSLSMLLLWPYVSSLKLGLSNAKVFIYIIRTGLVFGMLVGAERLLIHDLSHWFYKAHEALALLSFFGLYLGILGLLIQTLLQQRDSRLPVLLAAIPLVAIGIQLFRLYLIQRELGWVDASWREKGIPVWVSFAFWQWWLIGFLWLGLGVLSRVIKK